MCFSASASFVVSAALLPVGAFTLRYALHNDRRYLPLAAFPMLFGAQQVFEGLLWLEMSAEASAGAHLPALGFLFFAYLFWPAFVPFAASRIDTRPKRQRVFRWLAVVGLLFGLSLYLPLLFHADWLSVTIHRHSILYRPELIYDGILPRTVVRGFYAAIVSLPLLMSSVASLRHFGLLILASVILSAIFFVYAFVSIWCFFAAILSLFVIRVLLQGRKAGLTDADGLPADHLTPGPR